MKWMLKRAFFNLVFEVFLQLWKDKIIQYVKKASAVFLLPSLKYGSKKMPLPHIPH